MGVLDNSQSTSGDRLVLLALAESADIEAVETATEQPKTPIRSNYMVDTPVVDIEIPKDIEAGRNIAQ